MQNCRFGKDVNLELPKDEPPSRQASIKKKKKIFIYIYIKFILQQWRVFVHFSFFLGGGGVYMM